MTVVEPDPIAAVTAILERAKAAGGYDHTAMTLATVGPDGRPACRFVLLKGIDARGFVFFTNLSSRKAEQIAGSPFAALCFYWASILVQVRVEGTVEPIAAAEADAYFASRPRGHQLSAWASRQSSVLDNRATLERRFEEYTRRFEGEPVPRPPFWSGYRVIPDRIEIWTHHDDRMHDRLLYTRTASGGWTTEHLYP